MPERVLAVCEEDAARHEKLLVRGAAAQNRANHVETADVHGGRRRLRIIGQHEREEPEVGIVSSMMRELGSRRGLF